MNKIIRKDTVQTFTHDQYEVRVIWIEYAGGGMSYEFEVEDAGTVIHMSEDGHGQALPAAAGAYAWVENHTNGVDDQPDQDAQPDQLTALANDLTRYQQIRNSVYDQIEMHMVSEADIEAMKQLGLDLSTRLQRMGDGLLTGLDYLDNALFYAEMQGLVYLPGNSDQDA